MPTAKVHPPNPLPPKSLTQQQFEIWSAELQAWLSSDETQAQFLPGSLYETWQSEEQNPHRIAALLPGDPDTPDNATAAQLLALVTKRRRQCKVFLSLVAKCVSENHYLEIIRHATSLTWVFDLIKRDYDLKITGIDFLNLSDIKYEPETMTPAAYFQKVKSHIMANTARAGQVIQHINDQPLAADETLGPCFQDYILYNTIRDIDPRLIKHIQTHYKLKIAAGQRLTDLKSDIFINIPKFLEEIQQQESLSTLRAQASTLASLQSAGVIPSRVTLNPHVGSYNNNQDNSQDNNQEALHEGTSPLAVQAVSQPPPPHTNTASLAAFGQRFQPPQNRGRGTITQNRGRGNFTQSRRPFCKTCYDSNKGKDTYLSHATANPNCPSRLQFNSIESYPEEVVEVGDHTYSTQELEQVYDQDYGERPSETFFNHAGLAHIEPVPAQILSLTDGNNLPIHVELDNGATSSYIVLNEAINRGYIINPNSQSSQLGDGVTIIKSCGEIDVTFYRNSHKLRFRAIVARNLHCPVIGGTTFIKDNNIKQDFVHNQISLLGNKCIVPSTRREALLPISQHHNTIHNTAHNRTHKLNSTTPITRAQGLDELLHSAHSNHGQDDPSRVTLNPTLGSSEALHSGSTE